MDSHLYTLSALGLRKEKDFNSNLRDDAEESEGCWGRMRRIERKFQYEIGMSERASEREREDVRGDVRRKKKRERLEER